MKPHITGKINRAAFRAGNFTTPMVWRCVYPGTLPGISDSPRRAYRAWREVNMLDAKPQRVDFGYNSTRIGDL